MKEDTKRVVAYLPKSEHKQLKIKLATQGRSISEWFREIVKRFLGES